MVTTLYFERRPAWMSRAEMLDRTAQSPLRLLMRLISAASQGALLVLDGGVGARGLYVDRVAAAVAARIRRCAGVVITDATWADGATPLSRRLRRMALRLVDSPKTWYCVLSDAERRSFPCTWRIAQERVFHTPFYWTLPDEVALGHEPEPDRGYVFSGGGALRDYRTLVDAVKEVPAPVIVAARRFPDNLRPLPPNMSVAPVSPDKFTALLARAQAVVLPLVSDSVRSAGQQTYLNAMVLGRPVIVTAAPGVTEHVTDSETGRIVPPSDAAALARAIVATLTETNGSTRMGRRARESVLARFSPDAYVTRLLEVVDAVEAEIGRRAKCQKFSR